VSHISHMVRESYLTHGSWVIPHTCHHETYLTSTGGGDQIYKIFGFRDLTIFATLYLACYHESYRTHVTMSHTSHTCVLVCVSVLSCLTSYHESYHTLVTTSHTSHMVRESYLTRGSWVIPHTCHNETYLTSTCGGDHTSNISISKSNEFLVH